MQPPNHHHHSRINLAELKAQMIMKLGPERSKQYFYYLTRFLSLKLTKLDFNKLCLGIIGRENIPLHNQFIRSILKNACISEVPPPASHTDSALKHGMQVSANGSHPTMTRAFGSPGLSNGGDVLPPSPRKARTGFRRAGDWRTLGSNGKTCLATQSSNFNTPLKNGDLDAPNVGRSVWQHQGLNGSDIMVRGSPDGSVSPRGKNQALAGSPLQAPLGVQFCPGIKSPASSRRCTGTLDDDVLLDSLTLRESMEQISAAHGLEGASMDSANILNHGLDSYMKGLIKTCIELVGSRSGLEQIKNNANKHHSCTKLINGVKPGHQHQMQRYLEVQELKPRYPISLQDFRVAMELNPLKLGVDWPLLLENICTHPFDK